MKCKFLKSQAGFGFFGMMVLVIFLALAGSFVMVTITSTKANRAMEETIIKMDIIERAAKKYEEDSAVGAASYGSPPSTVDGIAGLLTDIHATGCSASYGTSRMKGWCGPYIDIQNATDPTDYARDGWGTTFSYSATATTGTLTSYGPNKVSGGGDDITRTF